MTATGHRRTGFIHCVDDAGVEARHSASMIVRFPDGPDRADAAGERPPRLSTDLPAEWLAGAADLLATPLLLLRGDAGLVHANRAGREALDGGVPLRLDADGRVAAAAAADRAALREALRRAAGGRRQLVRGTAAPGTFLGTLTPLDGTAEPLLLLALVQRGLPDLDAFAAVHRLSAAEARVLRRLAAGERTAQIATALRLAEPTVRSHVLSLRRKTGHASVNALLRAVAALPPIAPLPRRG